MKKKLTAKIQQLNSTLPQYAGTFSKCVVIEPETKETLSKKGAVYAVYDIQSESSFDTELISKVINDVIHNSYYQSDNISPIQSMEKAILELKDKIMQLSSNVISAEQQLPKFNIITTVLWGNVMYTIQYGEMACYLMKGGMIKQVNMVAEGNFSAASIVVSDDDVAIISSKAFEKELPPEKLLTSSVSEQTLKNSQACLIMKMVVDTNLTEEETVDFGLAKAISKNKSRETGLKVTETAAALSTTVKSALAKIFKKKVQTLATIALPKAVAPRIKKPLNKLLFFLPAIIIIVTGASLIIISKGKKTPDNMAKQNNTIVETKESTSPPENAAEAFNLEEEKTKDVMFKVFRIDPKVFYDLKIANEQANVNDLTAFADKLVSTDKDSGVIYISDRDTPKFSAEETVFAGIRLPVNFTGRLGFIDNTGYKVYNLPTSAVTDEYTITSEIAFPYSGFLYTINADILKKFKDSKAVGSTWAQNNLFIGAKSMAIAYDIYVATSTNDLVSFSAGEKTTFTVKGLEKGFGNILKIVADIDLDYIYVADKENKSVVLLNDKGDLVKQYKTQDPTLWEDLRSIAVSPDEKVLYILAGTKVYTVDL